MVCFSLKCGPKCRGCVRGLDMGNLKLGENWVALSKMRWQVSVDRRFPEDPYAFGRVCEFNDFDIDDIPSFLESPSCRNKINRPKKTGKGKLGNS